MGVPKFYRWLVERYPCLNDVIDKDQIPVFDNLYLDMNGIIHNCTHSDDDDFKTPNPREKMFNDICLYVDYLFSVIKPRKVFFMAVDGVAPRAKMNQQRARRFMSAKNVELQIKKAKNKGLQLSADNRFDPNCITPGTEFMAELHENLEYFIAMKISTDPLWQGIKIYFSGHNCPGEGEHKIMDFIRSERSQANYNPNTRHCLYGLDADLIMLGLCSHEPYFSLLREKITFGRPRSKGNAKNIGRCSAENTSFNLLHISLLREYINWEFYSIRDKLTFIYDLEAIIDDWVLMGFLVGNDFIPNLPDIHMLNDSLALLCKTYLAVLPELDGYINECGVLNLKRFEIFLKRFATTDRKYFIDRMDDAVYLASKRLNANDNKEEATYSQSDGANIIGTGKVKGAFDSDTEDEVEMESEVEQIDEEIQKIIPNASNVFQDVEISMDSSSSFYPTDDLEADECESNDEDGNYENDVETMWTQSVNRAFKNYKRNYYFKKLNYINISKDELRAQAEGYVRAIQWNLHYYYHGCCSWNWYYEHHYAPFISDILDFEEVDMNFELSSPFTPFEQLLAVLPAASGKCLPEVLRVLMTDDSSPIKDFFPEDFSTDLNGKKNDWESVVLLPFVDEKRLFEAMAPKLPFLTADECKRNTNGPHLLFTTDKTQQHGFIPSIANAAHSLPLITNSIARREEVDLKAFQIDRNQVVYGILDNVQLETFNPDFPTMKYLPHSADLRYANITVFNQPSIKQSMILKILQRPEFDKDIKDIASDLIDQEVFINWPILKKALANQIWTADTKYFNDERGKLQIEKLSRDEIKLLQTSYLRDLNYREMVQRGIDMFDRNVIVLVKLFVGTKLVPTSQDSLKKLSIYEKDKSVPVFLSLIFKDPLQNASQNNLIKLNEIAVGREGFLLTKGLNLYGRKAVIIDFDHRLANCYLPKSIADFSILSSQHDNVNTWMSIFQIMLNFKPIPKKVINNITASVYLYEESPNVANENKVTNVRKMNIGLQIKFTTRKLAVPGFAQRIGGEWFYSDKTLKVLDDYLNRFPEVFNELSRATSCEIFEDKLWNFLDAEEKTKRKKELKEFLHGLPSASIPLEKDDYICISESFIERIEALSDVEKNAGYELIPVNFQPENFYQPELHIDLFMADETTTKFKLFDRVVCVKRTQNVCVGEYGVVIGVRKNSEGKNSYELDVLFDSPFFGGKVFSGGKRASGARIPSHALINLTHNQRMINETEVNLKTILKFHPQSNKNGVNKNARRQSVGKYLEYRNSKYIQRNSQEKVEVNTDMPPVMSDLQEAKFNQMSIGSCEKNVSATVVKNENSTNFVRMNVIPRMIPPDRLLKHDPYAQDVNYFGFRPPPFNFNFNMPAADPAYMAVNRGFPEWRCNSLHYRGTSPRMEQWFSGGIRTIYNPPRERNISNVNQKNELQQPHPSSELRRDMMPTQVMRSNVKMRRIPESPSLSSKGSIDCGMKVDETAKGLMHQEEKPINEISSKTSNENVEKATTEASSESQPLTREVSVLQTRPKRGSRVVANFSKTNF